MLSIVASVLGVHSKLPDRLPLPVILEETDDRRARRSSSMSSDTSSSSGEDVHLAVVEPRRSRPSSLHFGSGLDSLAEEEMQTAFSSAHPPLESPRSVVAVVREGGVLRSRVVSPPLAATERASYFVPSPAITVDAETIPAWRPFDAAISSSSSSLSSSPPASATKRRRSLCRRKCVGGPPELALTRSQKDFALTGRRCGISHVYNTL